MYIKLSLLTRLTGYGPVKREWLTGTCFYSIERLEDGTYEYVQRDSGRRIKIGIVNFNALIAEYFLAKGIPDDVLSEHGIDVREKRDIMFDDNTALLEYNAAHADESNSMIDVNELYATELECHDYVGKRLMEIIRAWCVENDIIFEDDETGTCWVLKPREIVKLG